MKQDIRLLCVRSRNCTFFRVEITSNVKMGLLVITMGTGAPVRGFRGIFEIGEISHGMILAVLKAYTTVYGLQYTDLVPR